MAAFTGLRGALAFGVGAIVLANAPAAWPQAPLPPEIAEISACLCLQRTVDGVSAEMNAKNQELDQKRAELAGLDAALAQERARVDVNAPESVARFKLLLERRDAAFKNANGPLVAEVRAVIERYDTRVGQYNSRCASRPFDPVLMSQVQASLSCPPPGY